MIFIVGTGRCGTNLLRRILNQNPDICISTETHFITTLIQIFGEGAFSIDSFCEVAENHWTSDGRERWLKKHLEAGGKAPTSFREDFRVFCEMEEGTVRQWVEAFFAYCYGEWPVFGEKTPQYGLHMKAISQQWPGAKFVHMVRDGRYVAPSMQKHDGFVRLINAGFPDEMTQYSFEDKLSSIPADPVSKEQCIRLWERLATDIRSESNQISSLNYIEVKFENLLLFPLWEIVRIYRFLRIPLSPLPIARGVRMPESFKVSGQLKDYEPSEYNRLTEVAEEGLEQFGYSTDTWEWTRYKQTVSLIKEISNWLLYHRFGSLVT